MGERLTLEDSTLRDVRGPGQAGAESPRVLRSPR